MKAKRLMFTNLAFLLFAIVLIALSLFSYQRINKQVEAAGWVDHTYRVKFSLETAFRNLYKAESSQRGYILTNDQDLYKQFVDAKAAIPPILRSTNIYIADNPEQSANLKRTRELFDRRILWLNIVVDTVKKVSRAKMDSFFMVGKTLTDSISAQISLMSGLEDGLLKQRLLEREREGKISSAFVLFLSIFSICILLYAFLRLKTEGRLLTASIIDKNFLEKMVAERTSEILSANEKLNQQNEELEQKNAELNSFTFIASHDLKEPLRKIEMYSSKLLSENHQHISDNGKIALNKINDSIQKMKNLIDSIFSYAQVEQGLELKLTDLNDIVSQSINTLSESIEEKKALISFNGLPSIMAIPEQMEQLFTNLIGNSLKYAKSDRPPKITISAEKLDQRNDGNYWKIVVGDNGVGFDEKYREKIFQIFQRAHSKNQYPGTGIGLAICRKIVENHRGNISANSGDEGAIFTIILPEGFN